MKKEAHLTKNYNLFVNSFKKINPKTFFIIFFDLLFFVFLPLIVLAPSNIIQKKLTALEQKLSTDIMTIYTQNLASEVAGFFFFFIALIMLIIILIIINYSIFKGIVWCMSLNKKFNLKFFFKFLLLNLRWLGLYCILLLAFGMVFKSEPMMFLGLYFHSGIAAIYQLILTIFWIYFTNIIYTLFIKNKKKPVREGLKFGFKNLFSFFLPYLTLTIILSIIFLITRSFISLFPTAYGIGLTIISILLLSYLAWARYYIIDVIESIK